MMAPVNVERAADSYALDERQRSVANAPPNQHQLVLSPPGTGKTHVVVARLRYLITEAGLSPEEILVLCFSRAAVAEVVRRIAQLVEGEQLHDNLRFVTIRTFDSFATRLLLATDPEIELGDAGYDERIRMAMDSLASPVGAASRQVARVKHLIVDEIQDLVGVRASLVQALLRRISGGFTLLGDPAQAIYGFSIRGEQGAITPAQLIRWIRDQDWGAALVETELQTDYRSRGATTGIATTLRAEILAADEADQGPLLRLREVIAALPSAGSASTPAELGDGDRYGSASVLCRSHGEALQVARFLGDAGISTSLRARPEDGALPPWIARALGRWTRPSIKESEFVECWDRWVGRLEGVDRARAWRWLKSVEGEGGNDLRLSVLRRALRRGQRLPDEADAYLQGMGTAVSVGTIHSVKGREFDRVIILEPDSRPGSQESPLEEARVLYVAATRAREELLRLDRLGIPALWTEKCGGDRERWVAKSPDGRRHFFEVGCEGDFQPESPVSEYVHENRAAAEQVQDYIWSSVVPGDTVDIHKAIRRGYAFYDVKHRSEQAKGYTTLGQLSLTFKNDMKEVLERVSARPGTAYPKYLNDIRVVAITTELIRLNVERVHEPFASSGFCLGLRLRGMGYLCGG